MARTVLTPKTPTLDGVLYSWTVGTADGHQVPWASNLELHFKNANVGALVFTLTTTNETASGAGYENHSISVAGSGDASGGMMVVGALESAPWRQADGNVYINFATPADQYVMAVLTQKAT